MSTPPPARVPAPAPSAVGVAARDRGAANLAGICWARTVVELKLFFRERSTLVFVFAFPVVMLAVFAAAFSGDPRFAGAGAVSISAAQYYLTGMVSSGVLLTSFQHLALSIAVERDDGTLKRLRGTPMPPVALVVGKVAQVLLSTAVQLVLLLAVARIAYGVPLPSGAGAWGRLAWLVVLGCACGTALGVAYSSVPRSARTAAAAVMPVAIVLQFVSGVYVPVYELPGWMQQVAGVFPLRWLAQGVRSVLLPPGMEAAEPGGSWRLGATALVLASWLLLGLVIASRTFRWARHGSE